jgi:predicted deacylase
LEFSIATIRQQDPWYCNPETAIRLSTWTEVPRGQLTHYEHPVVGDDTLTRERGLPVTVVTGVEDGPVLLLIAGEHGNEYESIIALQETLKGLNPAALRGTVVGVNCCSVDSYLYQSRVANADGQNLARVYPGKANGTLTERVAYTLQNDFLGQAAPHKPTLMVALHTFGPRLMGATLSGYNIYPGEPDLSATQRQISLQTGLPLVWGHEFDASHAAAAVMGHEASGRTALYAAFLAGIPAVYWETAWGMGGEAEYIRGLSRLMVHLDMVDGENAPLEPREFIESTGHGAGLMSSHNQSPVAGLWRPAKAVWDQVSQGDLLGIVYDLYGRPAHEIRAQQEGVVISLAKMQYLNEGTHCGIVLNKAR